MQETIDKLTENFNAMSENCLKMFIWYLENLECETNPLKEGFDYVAELAEGVYKDRFGGKINE